MTLPTLAPRPNHAHKGTFGCGVLIGGSRGMAGAIALAGMAALRSGTGLVRLGIPERCLETVASFHPCYTTVTLPNDEQGRLLAATPAVLELIAPATAVAFGPGVGRSASLNRLAEDLYTQVNQPLVVDADGLNALAERAVPLAAPGGPRILTPHPGEFARLMQQSTGLDWEALAEQAITLARQFGVVIVLKGHRSLITDGTRSKRNSTGNPGMATGGSGDVLTGIITALLCQGLAPFEAAHLGCYLHGTAGDLAAEQLGQVSLTARDLIEALPRAFQNLP